MNSLLIYFSSLTSTGIKIFSSSSLSSSNCGGSIIFSPIVSNDSSWANPGGSVAISNKVPPGSLKVNGFEVISGPYWSYLKTITPRQNFSSPTAPRHPLFAKRYDAQRQDPSRLCHMKLVLISMYSLIHLLI